MFNVIVYLFLTMILSAVITPFVIKLAYILGAVDNPNARRVNKKPMPTMVEWLFLLLSRFRRLYC